MASIGARTAAEKALGGLTRRSIRDGEVLGRAVHADVASGAYMLYKGKSQPLGMEADSTAATGAAGVEHVALLPGVSQYLHYFPIVNAGNVLVPPASADGLDLTLSQTNDEGCQYVPGGLFGPWRMTVERTANQVVPKGLFIRLRAAILDVSGTDDFAVGFRKAEAVQAAIDGYDEAAWLNAISGNVFTETILNNGTTVAVDTTDNWADTEEHEFEVQVDGKGKVYFFFDGAQPTVTQAFQFDDAEVLVPFIYALQAADLTTINVKELEVGTLEQRYNRGVFPRR